MPIATVFRAAGRGLERLSVTYAPRVRSRLHAAAGVVAEELENRMMLAATPAVFYVDASVGQSGDGSTLAKAFKTIQEAADAAAGAQTAPPGLITVDIATGTYRETVTVKCPDVTFASLGYGPVTVSGLNPIAVHADSNCAITSVSAAAAGTGYDATVQIAGANSFSVGDTVNVSGVDDAAYDGSFQITAVDQSPNATVIHYSISRPPAALGPSAPGASATAQSITWSSDPGALPVGGAAGNGYSAVTGQPVLGPSATTATDQVFIDAPAPVLLPPARFPQTMTPGQPDIGSETRYQNSPALSLLRIPDQRPYTVPAPPPVMSSATFYDPSLSAISTALGTSADLTSVLSGATVHIAPGAEGFANPGTGTWVWETFTVTSVSTQVIGGATVYGLTYSIPAGSVLQSSGQQPQWGDFYYLTDLNLTSRQAVQLGVRPVSISSITFAGNGQPVPKNTQANVSYVIDSSNVLHLSYFGNPGAVEVKQRDIAFDLSGESDVTVQGINLVAATIVTDKNSTNATINGISASFLSAYDRTGISVVVDHAGPFLNLAAGQTTPPSLSDAFCGGWLQFDSGIQLLGRGDTLENSTIDSCWANGVTVGADGVTVSGCHITNVDIMADDNAGIVTDGSMRPIVGVTASTAGAAPPLSDPSKPSFEGLVNFELTIPDDPAIAAGVWIYVANLQLINPSSHGRFQDTYAGAGTYLVTRTAPVSGGNMLVDYQERVPAPDYYQLYQDGLFVRDQDASSAAGVVSVVVGQSAPISISGNVIADSARCDITYRGAVNITIDHNDLSNPGLDTTDLGAIYCWGEDVSSLSSNSSVVISYNTIHGVENGAGIYVDNGNSGVTVVHNLVYDSQYGVTVNSGGMNTVVEYNTLDTIGAPIASGPITYYDPASGAWVDRGAGGHINGTALYNNLNRVPAASAVPGGSSAIDFIDALYGFNLGSGVPSIAAGNNVAVAIASTPTGASAVVGPTGTLDAVSQSGTAYMYEDLGAVLGTAFHATAILVTFGSRLPAQFSISTSNDAANWTAASALIPQSALQSVNGAMVYDAAVDLTGRYVKLSFQPMAGNNDVLVANLAILGASSLAAATGDGAALPAPSAGPAAAANAAGSPDPAFGGDGGANRGLSAQLGAIMLSPTGSVVVSDRSASLAVNLRRFTPAGQWDTSYGTRGLAAIGSAARLAAAGVMAPYRDGGMVLGDDGLVSRISAAGKPVKSFGIAGTQSIALTVLGIAVQKDGKILLWGTQRPISDASLLPGAIPELMRLLPNGKLDKTFGSGGIVKPVFPELGGGTVPGSVALLPNGDIVVSAVQSDQLPDNASQARTERGVVARFAPGGSLDGSFASGGIDVLPLTTPGGIPAIGAVGASVAVQPDGSFLVVYDGNPNASAPVPLGVYRFTSTGALDTSFGTMGFTDLPNAPIGGGYRAFVRPDGKIELVGGNHANASLSLLNSDGTIDTQFGSAGTVIGLAGNPVAAFEQKDGKIVVAADNTWDGGTADDVALVRYGLDGKLDDTFGYHGVAIDPLGISGATNAVAVQKDSKILNVGSERAPVAGLSSAAAIVRYNPNGTPDATFGAHGRILLQIGQDAAFTAAAVAPGGMIYAAATGDNGSPASPVYAIYRFTKSGTLDRHFGIKGRVLSDGPIGDLKVLANGDVLAVTHSNGAVAAFISRYLKTGRLDPKFGVAGRASLGASSGDVEKLLVEPDGSIIEGDNRRIAKFTANGQPDTSFGTAAVPGLNSMALAPNGDIVAAGSDLLVTRLLPTGLADPTFASAGILSLKNTSLMLKSIQGVAVQPGGRIVIGAVQWAGGPPSLGLVGIAPTGVVDPSFSGGFVPTGFAFRLQDPLAPSASIPALLQQPDGNLLIAANFPSAAEDTPSRLLRVVGM